MVGKFITGWCIWKGNQKAESQRQRMEAKLHAYHQQKGGASVPIVNFRNFYSYMSVRADPYAQGPVFEHAETAVGYCLCSGESALAENLHVKRNFGESLVPLYLA